MISKNQLKLIHALEQKKQRKKQGLFLVQGEKNVAELFHSDFTLEQIFATSSYINKNSTLLSEQGLVGITVEATEAELKKAGTLARKELEELLEMRVFLECYVKTQKRWRDDVSLLQEFGYGQ